MKKNIVTIWWWNGQSNLLYAIYNSFLDEVNLSSIVSMSDDGRTTWELMRLFDIDLNLHFPPPWDLRRCLFSLSKSKYREDFKIYFEKVIDDTSIIKDLSLKDMFLLSGASLDFLDYLEKIDDNFLEFNLPLDSSIKWHKLWNLIMWCVYYNLNSYDKMMSFMHKLLSVSSNVIPVTTDPSFIEAELEDGNIIEKQDNISNHANYKSKIKKLRLMEWSRGAKLNYNIYEAISNADYIVIWPGDLYTSSICNLIIWEIKKIIKASKAKIIFIVNNTNKWWETNGYSVLDFIIELEKYLWRSIDYIVANDKNPNLYPNYIEKLKNDISVKGGEYIFLSDDDKSYLESKGVKVVEGNLIDRDSLYKHDKKSISNLLKKIIFF